MTIYDDAHSDWLNDVADLLAPWIVENDVAQEALIFDAIERLVAERGAVSAPASREQIAAWKTWDEKATPSAEQFRAVLAAVEAYHDAADEVERLREEVEVWKHTAERAQALSARCMRDERAARTALAAEAAKFQAETLTTSFLMCRIRRHIEEFDRSALTCDRCGWRGARVVHVDGDLRELRCGHERCLLARLAARIAETAPEEGP